MAATLPGGLSDLEHRDDGLSSDPGGAVESTGSCTDDRDPSPVLPGAEAQLQPGAGEGERGGDAVLRPALLQSSSHLKADAQAGGGVAGFGGRKEGECLAQ